MFKKIFSKSVDTILYCGDNIDGYYNLKYWIPEFMKSQINFSMLVRDETLYKALKNDYFMLKVIYAKSAKNLDDSFSKLHDLKRIFYITNASNNIHPLSFMQYKHIFIGTEHFDRDDQVTKMLRAYDELWLSSQASIDKIKSYFDVDELSIKLIGKPQLQNLSKYSKKNPKSVLFTLSTLSFDIKLISDILSNLSNDEYIVDILLNDDIEKNNPFFKNIKNQLLEYILLNHLKCNIISAVSDENINKYETVICDAYTYNYKFLALDTKIYIYIKKDENINTIFPTKYISFDGLYQFDSSIELKELLKKSDFMKEEREKFVEYWIGDKLNSISNFI